MKVLWMISVLSLVKGDHFTEKPCPDRPVIENFHPEMVKLIPAALFFDYFDYHIFKFKKRNFLIKK